MPRGVKREVVYTGKALKLHEKIQKLEADLKTARASDASDFVNGQVLYVDGGIQAYIGKQPS